MVPLPQILLFRVNFKMKVSHSSQVVAVIRRELLVNFVSGTAYWGGAWLDDGWYTGYTLSLYSLLLTPETLPEIGSHVMHVLCLNGKSLWYNKGRSNPSIWLDHIVLLMSASFSPVSLCSSPTLWAHLEMVTEMWLIRPNASFQTSDFKPNIVLKEKKNTIHL